MELQVADHGTDACVSALHRAGLELREHAEEGNGTAFLLQGNTFAHKELLKRYGGRWSRAGKAGCSTRSSPFAIWRRRCRQTGRFHRAASPMRPRRSRRRRHPSPLRKRAQNSGHRNRLRARFLEAGPQALPDYELLELLLFFSIDVKDTKPLAKELLARYGGLGGVLNAEPSAARRVPRSAQGRSPEIDAYLAYRDERAYQRDREAAPDGALSEEGSAGAPSSRTTRAGGRSSVSGAGARPRSCSRRSASSCSGCCARRSRSGR